MYDRIDPPDCSLWAAKGRPPKRGPAAWGRAAGCGLASRWSPIRLGRMLVAGDRERCRGALGLRRSLAAKGGPWGRRITMGHRPKALRAGFIARNREMGNRRTRRKGAIMALSHDGTP